MTDIHSIKLALSARARSLGAVAVGVSSAQTDSAVQARLRAAIARGDLATWRYEEHHAQSLSDPTQLLSGAQSVFCLALPYGHPAPRAPRGAGLVSSYVWGHDYHRVMRGVLDALLAEIAGAAPLARAIAVCDTKPLAERAFAARAGLGWVGKHTNLIVPGVGSYVFLGEIVTDLALEPDQPRKTHCGSCQRCIVACPTGALRGDYTMDATRCIADLTQRRDAIPRELRPLIGSWIWGCDLCQNACPPVARAKPQGLAAFAPGPTPYPDLLELLASSSAELQRRYAQSAMVWRGASVLRRNAAVALGNERDRASVPGLARALVHDGSALVRAHVAWALGRIASPAALDALRAAWQREPNADVRTEIEEAIGDISGLPCVQAIMEDEG